MGASGLHRNDGNRKQKHGNGNMERKYIMLATVLRQELKLYFILFILG